MPSSCGGQKKVFIDPLELKLDCGELPNGCWESSLDPLEEQPLSHLSNAYRYILVCGNHIKVDFLVVVVAADQT